MRSRKKWLIASALLAGLAAAAFFAAPQQPRYQGRPLSAWLNDLGSEKVETRQAAENAIKAMGPAAVPYLTNSVAKRDALALRLFRKEIFPKALLRQFADKVHWHSPVMESRNAGLALSLIAQDAGPAVPTLIAALQDSSPLVQGSASMALTRIGGPAVPALRERLKVPSGSDQLWVLITLGEIGTNALIAASDIAQFLGGATPTRDYASAALAKMGPEVVPILTNALADTNPIVRLQAANALTSLRHFGISATNALLSAANDPDPATQRAIWHAIYAVRTPAPLQIPVWLQGLHSDNPENVSVALNYLALFPRALKTNVAQVEELLRHPAPKLRESASNIVARYDEFLKN